MLFNVALAISAVIGAACAASPAPATSVNEFPKGVCTVEGLTTPLVVGVAYNVPGMWKCVDAKSMYVWCTKEGKLKNTDSSVKTCCGANCKKAGVPAPKFCSVGNKKIEVGKPVVMGGNTVWCINGKYYRTCETKKKCGSTPALTPPNPKPAKVVAKPESFKNCKDCTKAGFAFQNGQCMERCMIADLACARKDSECSAVSDKPPAPERPASSTLKTCQECTDLQYAWQNGQCMDSCMIADLACARKPNECSATNSPNQPSLGRPEASFLKKCKDCTDFGYAWQNGQCMDRCMIADLACARRSSDCPDVKSEAIAKCQNCINGGKTWQPEAKECTNACAIQDISCLRDVSLCEKQALPVDLSALKDCKSCTGSGFVWQTGFNQCFPYCPPIGGGECIFSQNPKC